MPSFYPAILTHSASLPELSNCPRSPRPHSQSSVTCSQRGQHNCGSCDQPQHGVCAKGLLAISLQITLFNVSHKPMFSIVVRDHLCNWSMVILRWQSFTVHNLGSYSWSIEFCSNFMKLQEVWYQGPMAGFKIRLSRKPQYWLATLDTSTFTFHVSLLMSSILTES